ncbi:MAG: PHB depolymerase family esterase [Desulfobacteraceae bacterium]|nr:PHB depolymerase family esterase [Desulfobacteraceae bacterium]
MKKSLFILSVVLLICTGVVNAGTWQRESAGGFSEVYIYSPESVSPIGSGRSLLIALHGCAQTNEDMKGAIWEAASEAYGMVVALPEAMHKEGFGCWGYWSFPKNRNSKDYRNIRNLVDKLTSRPGLNIDKDQVYIAGLSSGGAFTMNVGCMMPDIFAGMGIDAGPSAGTDSSCAISRFCGSVNSTVRACQELAGSYRSFFDTQITSTAYGTSDSTVNQHYAPQNAGAMAKIYGAQEDGSVETIPEGTITTWSEDGSAAVSMVKLNNVGHAWPGGEGASGGYVDGSGFNYGTYLARFFMENNQRVNRNQAPDVRIISIRQNGSEIEVKGKATDPDPGDGISSLKIKFLDSCDKENVVIPEEDIVSSLNSDGSFSHNVAWPVNDRAYVAVIMATDLQTPPGSTTVESDPVSVGTPSAPLSIAILQQEAVVEDDCTGILLSGEAKQGAQPFEGVYVQVDSENFKRTNGTTSWQYKTCGLNYGKHTVIAKVIDDDGCIAYTEKVDINIPAPYQQKSGNTINFISHYAMYPNDNYPDAPSNSWGLCDKSYVELNSEYGVSEHFTIYGTEDGTVWCLNAGNIPTSQPETPADECEDWTSTNTTHENEGRAWSSWSFAFPFGFTYNYYAAGSNEPLGGGSDTTTLLQEKTGTGYYQRGKCPVTDN